MSNVGTRGAEELGAPWLLPPLCQRVDGARFGMGLRPVKATMPIRAKKIFCSLLNPKLPHLTRFSLAAGGVGQRSVETRDLPTGLGLATGSCLNSSQQVKGIRGAAHIVR